MIKKELFGSLDGKDVFLYTLDNGKDLRAEILSYGGIIKSLVYKGVDVVLGRDTLEDYLDNDGYYGALIGRNSNRIGGAAFELNGKTYTLAKNDGENNLHGGDFGFNRKVWDCTEQDGEEPALVLETESPDGEEGFPGNASVCVTYTLTKNNGLKMHYEGSCDADTVLNMTNHSYFNLNGHKSGTVDEHMVQINSHFYTPNTEECMPYGEVLRTEGTPFDLTSPKKLKEGFYSEHPQILLFGGYDHNFALDGRGFRLGAVVKGDKSGITMEMYTDRPAVQLYTGNCINTEKVCKDKTVYAVHQALCLETQAFPNAVHFSHYPTAFLKKGGKYDTVTEYVFK